MEKYKDEKIEERFDELENEDDKKVPKVVQLLNYIHSIPMKCFMDQFGQAQAALSGDGTKIVAIESDSFHKWIMHRVWVDQEQSYGSETIRTATKILAAETEEKNEVIELSVRTARRGNKVWYDLGEKAVEITTQGYTVVPKPDVLFRRFSSQKQQVEPLMDNGGLDRLMQLINIESEEERILLKVFLICCFIPGFPHPVLVIHGQKGAAKSTLFRLLKDLVDPWIIKTLSPIKDSRELIQVASHHWFAPFDNLSDLPDSASDDIARLVTGYGGSKRKLYKDDDDFIYNVQNVVAINGINNVVKNPDLMDRSLLIELSRISNDKRKSEKEIEKTFEEIKPYVLGSCFDLVSKALTIEPNVNLLNHNRMADFTVWGYAIAEALGVGGETFLKAYENNIKKQNDEAIEVSPIGSVILKYFQVYREEILEAEPTILLMKLSKFAQDNSDSDIQHHEDWPKDAVWLWRRLVQVAPDLEMKGIKITRGKKNENERFIRIYRVTDNTDSTDSISTAITGNEDVGELIKETFGLAIPPDEIPF